MSPESQEVVGISELTQVVDGLLDVVDAVVAVKAEGAMGLLKKAPALASSLPAAVVGADKVPAELADISEAEALELGAHVVGRLAVSSEKAKAIVEKSLKAAVALNELRKAIQA